jgi:amino acid transporter
MDGGESVPLLSPGSMTGAAGKKPTTPHGHGDEDHWEHTESGVVTTYEPSWEQIRMTTQQRHKPSLGQVRATSIAGNDITSSCFYTLGLCGSIAGIYSPISIALVSILLFFFRAIYSEVGTALPLNGGAYNCLLNATTKFTAALAACLTILSYTATSVVSAASAMAYLQGLWHQMSILLATCVLLGIFCALNLIGLSESAGVATGMFGIHLGVMSTLVGSCIVYIVRNSAYVWSTMQHNWAIQVPIILSNTTCGNVTFTLPPQSPYLQSGGSIPLGIFFGFAQALLGVSGFESSSNYIEEQQPGVFPKTLRNMWAITGLLNTSLCLLMVFLLPIETISQDSNNVLAILARQAAGEWLYWAVSVDAVIVLSGGVLTAFVGVTGLIRRMSMDRCLPQFFLKSNPWRKTNHVIIIGFFVLNVSLYLMVDGQLKSLAAVYTIAFLSVMSLFAIGNILLKYKRSKLPRGYYAPWIVVVLGLLGVLAGLVGNIVYDTSSVKYFVLYFAVTLLLVMTMFARIRVVKILLFFVRQTFLKDYLEAYLRRQVHKMRRQQPVVFFTKTDDIALLNKAVTYIFDNEITSYIKIVKVLRPEDTVPQAKLQANVASRRDVSKGSD